MVYDLTNQEQLSGGILSDENPNNGIRWSLTYPTGSNKIEVLDTLIESLTQYRDSLKRDEKIAKLRKVLNESFPYLLDLLNNPAFIEQLDEEGYEFDTRTAFRAIIEVTNWKFNAPVITERES